MITWLLGVSRYPLAPFLLTPIIGAEDNTPEGPYNKAHTRARNCVKRYIGPATKFRSDGTDGPEGRR